MCSVCFLDYVSVTIVLIFKKTKQIFKYFCGVLVFYVLHAQLVEEYTGQWQVPLPQLKVLRTALCRFTKATAAFPDDCQHIHYVLSSLAL